MIPDSLKKLERWGAKQSNLRLKLGPSLSKKEIDELPEKLASSYPYPLPVPFKTEHFSVPESYRDFLSCHSFVKIEYKGENRDWELYEPFNLFSPDEMAQGRSWTAGGTLDERDIYTTFLIAFATAGYDVEASRWCFYTDTDIKRKKKNELPILLESNDFECDLAKFVDTREWVRSAFITPAAYTFEEWFSKLVSIVTSKPFDPQRTDDIPNAFYPAKKT